MDECTQELLADYQDGRIGRGELIRRAALLGVGASLLPALGLLPAQAASVPAAAPAPRRGGTLRVAAAQPTTIEPPQLTDAPGIAVVQPVAEYLVTVDTKLITHPQLATSWKASNGARTWTFTLRRGVKFNNGKEMTADDVVATFKRLIKPPSTAIGSFPFLKAEGIQKVDTYTVAFHLTSAQADFPYYMNTYQAVILPADWPGNFAKNPIGTGPFKLVEYVPGQRARYVKNPNYWQKGLPYLDGAEILLNLDPQAQITALLGGNADVLVTTQPNTLPTLHGNANVKVLTAKSSGFNGIFVRCDKAPFNDVRVRQAMALAINRPAIQKAVDNGLSVIGDDTVLSSVFPVYQPIPQRMQDYTAAKKLLAQAGHPNGFSTTLTTASDTASLTALATVVQQMLKPLGITVSLKTEPGSTYYTSDWLNAPFTITEWAHRPTPSQFLDVAFRTNAVWNASHYSNKTLDDLISRLESTVGLAPRKPTAKQIELILNRDTPAILPTFTGVARAMRSTLQGVAADPSSFLYISGAYFSS